MTIPEIRRVKFFDGLLLRADDWEENQRYGVNLRRLHNCGLHEPGIVRGLEVEASNDGRSILVQPGHAIDKHGNDICLSRVEQLDVDAKQQGGMVYVTIKWAEKKDSSAYRDNLTNPDQSGSPFMSEKPRLATDFVKPDPEDLEVIELARVQLVGDDPRLSNPAGSEPKDNEIDSTHRVHAGARGSRVEFSSFVAKRHSGSQRVAGQDRDRVRQVPVVLDSVPAQGAQPFYIVNVYPEDDGEVVWRLGAKRTGTTMQYRLYFENQGDSDVSVRYSAVQINDVS